MMADAEPPIDRPTAPRLDPVPAPAVRRLSLYLRELEALLKRDHQTVSSKQLGELLGLTDAQVRKDLAYFGQFGHPGIGYRVIDLIARIKSILGTDRNWNVLLVGAGNLGNALLSYRGFSKKNFQIVAVFDNDPKKTGQFIGIEPKLEILPVERLVDVVRERDIQMAIISVPAEVAQPVADQLVSAGIRGILNFAPASLVVPESVAMASVDLAVHLEQLAFKISASQLASKLA
jgi:redox-sensing transcriptional repressor